MKILMKLAVLSLLLVSFPLLAAPPHKDPVRSIVSNYVIPYMNTYEIPGVAVGIYYNGNSYYYNYGVKEKGKRRGNEVTEDTIFNIGSITKAFTGTLLGYCVIENKCAFDDLMTSHIPELASSTNLPIGEITLDQLVTHTASLPRDPENLGVNRYSATALEDIWPALQAWTPDNPIGSNYLYSNLGFYLLSQVVSNINGTSFVESLNEHVTGPLGMFDTVVFMNQDQQARFAQSYGTNGDPILYRTPSNYLDGRPLLSTTRNMLTFLRANLGDPSTNVTPELMNALLTAQEVHYQINGNFLQCLGWTSVLFNQHVMIQKSGGIFGFRSYAVFIPDKNIAAVILVNKDGGSCVSVLRSIVGDLMNLN